MLSKKWFFLSVSVFLTFVLIVIISLIYDPLLIFYPLLISFFIFLFLLFYGPIFKFGSIVLRNSVDEFIRDIIIPEYENYKEKSESEEESGSIQLVWRVW
ncbi:MAG: hypothetical protein ACW981_20735 [Candidatus Hodarchaeales archaeon]|jgi:hypothetical protein